MPRKMCIRDRFKAQSQLLFAYAEATAPKLAVVTGDALGQAYVAMGGKADVYKRQA